MKKTRLECPTEALVAWLYDMLQRRAEPVAQIQQMHNDYNTQKETKHTKFVTELCIPASPCFVVRDPSFLEP